jgi:hypothetical protein
MIAGEFSSVLGGLRANCRVMVGEADRHGVEDLIQLGFTTVPLSKEICSRDHGQRA